MTLSVAEPDPGDDQTSQNTAILPGRHWMHENFFSPENVPELGTRGATPRGSSTTRAPVATSSRGSSTGSATTRRRARRRSRRSSRCWTRRYIPCVSMLDFWAPAGRLELVVYAHSLDFGKKAYGNLVELARLQELVAGELGLPSRLARRSTSSRPTSTSPSGS